MARTPPRKAKPPVRSNAKRRINLTVRADLVERARAAGLNFSQIAEEAILLKLREEAARRWQDENRDAIEHHRRRIERDGMWNKDLITF